MNTFLVPTGGGDWLLKPDMCADFAVKALTVRGFRAETARILIPGVGLSDIALHLYNLGVRHMVLEDIEQDAITHQRSLLASLNIDTVKLHLGPLEDLYDYKFDVIIDKSFMDVFIAQSGSRQFMMALDSLLRDDGVLVSFSMFNKAWKRLLVKQRWVVGFANVEVSKFSRTRPTIESRKQNISIFAACKRQHVSPEFITKLSMKDFSDYTSTMLPIDASAF